MIRTEWLYTRLGKALVDALVLSAALALGYLVRFDGRLPPEYLRQALALGPYVVGATLASFVFTGTYNRVWRYSNLSDVTALFAAMLVPISILAALRLTVPDPFV